MAHNHEHHHHHHSHEVKSSMGKVYIMSILLNLLFVGIETGVGVWSGSLGLVSDAGHNLSDVFSLILALIAFRLAATHGAGRYTYGYKKSSVLISLLNALILLVVVAIIGYEAVIKFIHPGEYELNAAAISWTAGIGILINGLTAWLLGRGDKHDINNRGAYLHMLADTLVSVGVVVSGIVISLTGWSLVDPVVSLVIAGIIFMSSWSLLVESLRMSMDATPESVDIEEIASEMREVDGVLDVHHIHVWAISTTENALTAHVVVDGFDTIETIRTSLRHELTEHGIAHSTLEFETEATKCDRHCC